MKISFNVEEISDILLPLGPVVDHIELNLQSSSEGYSALLDGLLWSCHPKILSVEFMDLESQSKFIMVQSFLCFYFVIWSVSFLPWFGVSWALWRVSQLVAWRG